jgi:hypothetical protein
LIIGYENDYDKFGFLDEVEEYCSDEDEDEEWMLRRREEGQES